MKLHSTLYRIWRIVVLTGAFLFGVSSSYAQSQFSNAQSVLDEIIALSKNAKYITAVEVGEKWLEANPLSDDAEESDAAVLTEIALNYGKVNQSSKALSLQLRALAIREKKLGAAHLKTAQSLANLAKTYDDLAQHDKALTLHLKALAIYEKDHGHEHVEIAELLTNLAGTYVTLEKFEKVMPLLERALAIREKVLGPEHSDTARSLNNLAMVYAGILSQFEKALPLQVSALAIHEKVSGLEHADTAESLRVLSTTYTALGQHDKALPLQVRALAISEKVHGPEHTDTATALDILALTHRSLAQYEKALPLNVRAVSINEKVYGSEHPYSAYSLINLSASYIGLGQYEKALPLLVRALSIYDKALGPDHSQTSLSLSTLALTYSFLAQHEKALPLHIRATTIYGKTLGQEHPRTAESLSNLAITYRALGILDKALSTNRLALSIREKVLGLEHPDTAVSLNNLALIYIDLAQYEQALPIQLRSLTIFQQEVGPEHPSTAQALNNLARILEGLSDPLAGVTLRKTAINIFQSQRERVSGIGPNELSSYTESVAWAYQSLAHLLIEQGRLAEAQQVLDMLKEDELFEFIRRSAEADPRRTRLGFNPEETRWTNRYKEATDRLAALGVEQRELQQKAKSGLTQKEQARLKSINSDFDVAQKAFTVFLSEMRSNLKAQGPAKVDEVAATSLASQRELQSIIRDLGPDVVLLQYYVTSSKVGVILTTPNVVIPFSTEIDAKVLNRQVFHLKNALRDPKLSALGPSQSLYQLLLAPVAKALEQTGAKTVMLSLDGQLRHIPFGALHDGTQFAAQRWNFPIYTSVTRDRLRDSRTPKWKAAGLGVTKSIGLMKALPAVKVEMDGLLRAVGAQSGQSVVYLDEKFTAQRLKELGQRDFQLMHISSHFTISPGTEVNSFLLLGDGQRLTLGDMRTQNFRFDNVDLLTLSACDTGVGGGRDNTGKEIEGLGVIAQQQGAKGVLATLWPVADGSTAKLMSDMYQRRQSQGLSKIEALRQAQLSMMSQPKYAHPFFWAPFILLGNWQ